MAFFMGMIKYFFTILDGINLITFGLISNLERLTEGTLYCSLRKDNRVSFLSYPNLTRLDPKHPPADFCFSNAF